MSFTRKEKMKKITSEQISNNMKGCRTRAGFSQEEVAKSLEVRRETVINWENKPGTVCLKTFIALADLYDCSVNDFFMA